MQFTVSFTDRTPVSSPDVALADVARRFAAEPAAQAFAVASHGVIVGLVERAAAEQAMQAGLGERPVNDILVNTPAREDPRRLLDTVEAEFRAQVQGLLAMTDRLARQHLGPDATAQVSSIRASGESLLRLTEDAKDMLRARSGGIELKLSPQPLRALMDQVQDRWTARAAETGVGFLISYDGDPDLAAMLDGERLTQVFENLIDNALRYTRQGSVEASLRARVDGEQIALEGRVRDTGPGLSAGKLAQAFDETETLSLPLSLTRSIVSSMGGSIHAEGNAGQGTTIVFRTTATVAGEAVEAAPQRTASGVPHVLVVDDNATNRMVAEALCEMFDCTSETAADGVEAIEIARNGRFDLILMDIKMPRMDGIAATKAIRALEGPVSQTPIVALTANVDPEDARTYMAAGMCCVVEKPIKPDRLLQAINLALGGSTTLSESRRVAAA
jgi:signal transduction histidine kinase/ActR/RegA family two-component response regulator